MLYFLKLLHPNKVFQYFFNTSNSHNICIYILYTPVINKKTVWLTLYHLLSWVFFRVVLSPFSLGFFAFDMCCCYIKSFTNENVHTCTYNSRIDRRVSLTSSFGRFTFELSTIIWNKSLTWLNTSNIDVSNAYILWWFSLCSIERIFLCDKKNVLSFWWNTP